MSQGYNLSVSLKIKKLNSLLNPGECIPYSEYKEIVGDKSYGVLRKLIRLDDLHIYNTVINGERCIYKKVMT